MGRRLKLSLSRQRELIRDYRAKVPTPDILKKYDVSKPTFYAYLRRKGQPHRRPECIPPKRPKRTYRPRPKRPEPVDFPFRYIPPKPLRATLWRCECGQLSVTGPVCGRCATNQEAA